MTDTKIERCPMPGCGSECKVDTDSSPFQTISFVACLDCTYRSIDDLDSDVAIAIHNAHCIRNRLAEAAEKLQEKPPFDKHFDQQSRVFNEGIQACLDMLPKKEE